MNASSIIVSSRVKEATSYLEVILAEDLVEQIKHLELHASDLVVPLRALGPTLIDHLVHGALPVVILSRLRGNQREQGAQNVEPHGAGG